ncbi:MAG: T9SS type A sorting domain-containing protein, partial [candidate division Zixibacteria bacterium]
SERIAFPVSLTTGHSYRLSLRLALKANQFLVLMESTADFFTTTIQDWGGNIFDDNGAGWAGLTVVAGQDLGGEIDDLLDKLENHGHTYLTGRGVGHNNTEAQTGIAIFFEDDSTDNFPTVVGDDFDDLDPLPMKTTLYPNYPNPFNPTTTLSFSIPEATHVSMAIYNTLGQKVRTLLEQPMSAGEHSILLDASDLASGVYFYRLTTETHKETRKLVLLK